MDGCVGTKPRMQCPQMMGSYLGWRLGSVYGDWLPQNLGFMQENRSLPFHPTLYGRVRYPLCLGCHFRPMQPMGSRRLAPKGMRCNESGGLYGGDVGILYGPVFAVDAFRLLCRQSGGMVTSLAYIIGRAHRSLPVCKHAQKSQSTSNSDLILAPEARMHSQLFRPPASAKRRRALAGLSRPPQAEGSVAEHHPPKLLTHLPQPLPLIRILGRGGYPHRRGIALHAA